MKDRKKDNNINNVYKKVKKYRIAEKIVSSKLVPILNGLLICGLTLTLIPLPNILGATDVISEIVGNVTISILPLIVFTGSIVVTIGGASLFSEYFRKKKDEAFRELMKLKNQNKENFDRTMPKTEVKIENKIKKDNNIKNNQVMDKLNLLTSVTNGIPLIKEELEEEWKIYLFDVISQGTSDEFVKEIISGLMLLNSDHSIENIYEKLSNNGEVIEALIYFSPKGAELENFLSKNKDNFESELRTDSCINPTNTILNLQRHK